MYMADIVWVNLKNFAFLLLMEFGSDYKIMLGLKIFPQ